MGKKWKEKEEICYVQQILNKTNCKIFSNVKNEYYEEGMKIIYVKFSVIIHFYQKYFVNNIPLQKWWD